MEQLTNSQDILNVLRAFPDLDKLFSNKKFAWMFDLVHLIFQVARLNVLRAIKY